MGETTGPHRVEHTYYYITNIIIELYYTYIYIYIYTCIDVYRYVCMYVYIYIYIYVYTIICILCCLVSYNMLVNKEPEKTTRGLGAWALAAGAARRITLLVSCFSLTFLFDLYYIIFLGGIYGRNLRHIHRISIAFLRRGQR